MRLVNISDIHIGKKDDMRLKEELEIFFDYLKDTENIDMITISGDLFDRVLTANEYGTTLALEFIQRLIDLYVPEIDIRIIKGTRSHDFNQLDILKVFKEKAGSHFKIIEKNEVEVFNGYKILYLPEEYPTDYDDFYKENLLGVEDKVYDFIIGHGMIDFIAFTGYEDDSEHLPIRQMT